MGAAVLREDVFLGVVEIGLAELDTRIVLVTRHADRALVDTVILQAGLEKDALWCDGCLVESR